MSVEYACNWILDGAKQPIYARLLIDVFGRDNVHVLHLVRDPRGVAFSTAKRRDKIDTGKTGDQMVRRSPLQSAFGWNKLDLSARALKREAASYRCIRYEDLCTNGSELIDDTMDSLGLKSDRSLSAVAVEATTHTISGNPIRMKGVPRQVVVDDAWRKELPAIDKLTVSAICLLGLLRYGYFLKRST